MTKIMPAVEAATRSEFEIALNKLLPLGADIQVDFNDGSFLDYKTVDVSQIADLLVSNNQKVNFEAHLMVQKPFDYIPKLIESGVKKIFLQYELEGHLRDLLDELEKEDCLTGLAIAPQTSIIDVEPFLDLIDAVNIMTINPGKQGQPFLPQNLNKINDLRNIGYEGEIEIDGGIDSETILTVKQFSPSTLVVGHYLTQASDSLENYHHLTELLEG